MNTWGLEAVEWVAVLRIGLGLWWLESVRHKNLEAWLQRNAGINWAASVAEEHRWRFVSRMFDRTVKPRPKLFTWIVLLAEFSLGVGITFGLLTPIALVASILLNLVYLVLMIHEFAEQGQNAMMAVMAAVCLGTQAWQEWSVDSWLGVF